MANRQPLADELTMPNENQLLQQIRQPLVGDLDW